MNIHSPAYQKAFIRYLRRGDMSFLSLKQDQPRKSHQVRSLNGWALDRSMKATEFAEQKITNGIRDAAQKWTQLDFLKHYYLGDGVAITLSEAGHLRSVIDYYFDTIGAYDRINTQIISTAKIREPGRFSYDFYNSYTEFRQYLYVLGGVTIGGQFNGTTQRENGVIQIEGNVKYYFKDTFTDPASVRERIINETSDPQAVGAIWRMISDGGGFYYDILDSWETRFVAVAAQ